MGSLTKKYKEQFDNISECLWERTTDGTVKWVSERSITNSNRSASFRGHLGEQKFTVNVDYDDSRFTKSMLTIWDETFEDGFLFSIENHEFVTKIGSYIFENEIKENLVDKEKEGLDSVLSKIGKDFMREKRLSELLDKKNKKGKEKEVPKTFWDRFKRGKTSS